MTLRIALITIYLVVAAILIAAMIWSRTAAEKWFGTEQAQADWQTWRNDVRDDRAGDGSVARRVPQSPVPPALALLRDHFLACTAIALVVSSALYWTFAFMIVGVLSNRTGARSSSREIDRL